MLARRILFALALICCAGLLPRAAAAATTQAAPIPPPPKVAGRSYVLIDHATGRVLAERTIEAAESFHMVDARTGLQPWDMMTPDEKVAALDRLLQRQIESELPRLFAVTNQ